MKQNITSANEVTLLNKPIRIKLQGMYILRAFQNLTSSALFFSRLWGLQLLQCILVMSAILTVVLNFYHQETKNV